VPNNKKNNYYLSNNKIQNRYSKSHKFQFIGFGLSRHLFVQHHLRYYIIIFYIEGRIGDSDNVLGVTPGPRIHTIANKHVPNTSEISNNTP